MLLVGVTGRVPRDIWRRVAVFGNQRLVPARRVATAITEGLGDRLPVIGAG